MFIKTIAGMALAVFLGTTAAAVAQSWQGNNGSGAVFFHLPSMSLVIKQSAEVHALLGSGGLLQ